MHLAGGAPESPSRWSASAIWAGGGVIGGVPVNRSIGGGGGEGLGVSGLGGGRWVWDGVLGVSLFGWSTGAVWVGVGSSEVRWRVGPCTG
jgi:hypothetical protein